MAHHLQAEQVVNNKWVADTPSEFRERLEEVFNLGVVKSAILNLLAAEGASAGGDSDVAAGAEGVGEPDPPKVDERTELS